METVLIEVRDQKSMTLLRNLEALDIIKMIDPPVVEKRRIAGRFAGRLSAVTAEQLDLHIQQRRNEWNSI